MFDKAYHINENEFTGKNSHVLCRILRFLFYTLNSGRKITNIVHYSNAYFSFYTILYNYELELCPNKMYSSDK